MKGFTNENIKFDVLRQRAYNMRWAEQDADVIPLTAADHDFPCAPEVVQALQDYIKEGYFTYTPHRGFPSFKKAIAKAFRYQKEGKGFCMVEVLSTCPTNWGLSPVEAMDWLEKNMIPYYPLGVYKDKEAK